MLHPLIAVISRILAQRICINGNFPEITCRSPADGGIAVRSVNGVEFPTFWGFTYHDDEGQAV
jgi:hypothetical protein